MNIRVLLVEDHQVVREGLRDLLEKQPDIRVVAEAGNGQAALSLIRETLPDVVVMDLAMPFLNGVETTRLIISEMPDVKVIALSMYSQKKFIISMLSAGAVGYLPKECACEELVEAVRTVAANHGYLSQKVIDIIVKDHFHRPKVDEPEFPSFLSNREGEVLKLLAEGKSVKEISNQLGVSVKTTETHRHQIMTKLKITSIAELTKYAVREGLTPLWDKAPKWDFPPSTDNTASDFGNADVGSCIDI